MFAVNVALPRLIQTYCFWCRFHLLFPTILFSFSLWWTKIITVTFDRKYTRNPSLEVAPTALAQRPRQTTEKGTSSSCDRELWPMTLTFKLDLDRVDMNQHAKYLGQRSFTLDTYTQTGPYVTSKMQSKLECGPMPNLMVALPNVAGALCSTPQSLADAHY